MASLRQWWKAEGWKPKLSEEIMCPSIVLETLVKEHAVAGHE